MSNGIRDNLELILAAYADARVTEPFGSDTELWGVFNDLKDTLSTVPAVRRRPTIRIIWSAGKANWAKVPWISLLDERETHTTQRGVYCVFLFREDLSGVYLTFNQGVTEPKGKLGKPKAHEVLREKAAYLRRFCDDLGERGFRLDDDIDLHADWGLGVDYESSTIAYKLYEADKLPDDGVVLADLEAVLSAYDVYLASAKWEEVIRLCDLLLEDRDWFDELEINYKLPIIDAVRASLDMTAGAEDFAQRLRKAFTHSANNLTRWQAHDDFTKWAWRDPEQARAAVRLLVEENKSLEERVDGFLEKIPNEVVSGPGTRISIASYLLMGMDPKNYPVYKPTPFEKVERALGWSQPLKDESLGTEYAHHRRFAQRLLKELQRARLDARDLLDVQSLIWILANDERPAFAIWRGETTEFAEILGTVTTWINNLDTRVSPDGRFHYKPLLLLALLDMLDADPVHVNRFKYEELRDAFMKLIAERGSTAAEPQFSQPYLNMKNDVAPEQVWCLETEVDSQERIDGIRSDNPERVRNAAPSIYINPLIWPVFKFEGGRSRIRQEILERWPLDNGRDPIPGRSLDELADKLLLDERFLEQVIELLRDKGQIIFYGPPGTGKTFVARKLMEYLAPEAGRREVVQFHPSYSYEDFVYGYRPITRPEGTLAYELKPGPFMRLVQQARTALGEHVLLIDEINRGNLPKILGELLYLLEYREDEVVLMYGEDNARFSLPKDLLIIGTMNTADRSIALIDAALRRRFHFVPFFPNEWPLQDLLRSWLARHRPEMLEVAGIVDKLNAVLREHFGPHLQIGPSYFMKKDLDEAALQRVWKYDVMPFLEDHLFGQEEELEGFKLERLRGPEDANHSTERIPAEPGTPDKE